MHYWVDKSFRLVLANSCTESWPTLWFSRLKKLAVGNPKMVMRPVIVVNSCIDILTFIKLSADNFPQVLSHTEFSLVPKQKVLIVIGLTTTFPTRFILHRTEKTFRNLVDSIQIWIQLPFSDWFGTKRNSVRWHTKPQIRGRFGPHALHQGDPPQAPDSFGFNP